MILVVSLNPALDITHHVEQADWAGVNRPGRVYTRPGGKGLNVARTLRSLGAETEVLGLAGGLAGAAVAAALDAAGVPATFIRIGGETRRTFTVVDSGRGSAALFSEPGPPVQAPEYAEFCDRYKSALPTCAAVVLTGSLPRGLAPGTYAELGVLAAAQGVPVLLDAHDDVLRHGATARPAIVKPNLAELEALAGRRLAAPAGPDLPAVAQAARELRAAGPEAVVVTLGPAGLWADTGEGCWHAAPPRAVSGNPTGAGDAVAAGLAHGLVLGRPWPGRLRHAVALGTAAALAPAAGEFSADDYRRLLPDVIVTRCEAP